MKMADGSTILRRNRPGTSAKDFCRWPDESFEEMDSTLAVQQYIQQTIRRDPTNIDSILNMPEFQDEGVWKYEHLRQFCMELNGLAVRLQEDCDPQSCTQMTATEQWIFLCAAHKTPKECPAIDYTRHTLDGAACLLNSNKYFPSRVSIKESSVAKLGSVCRRVYRIFSHAYFHHLNIFEPFEHETFLCRRFTAFVTKYKLMSKDNLIVPIIKEDGSAITTITSTTMTTGSAITIAATIPNTTVTTSVVAAATITTITTNPSTTNVTTTATAPATTNITTANTPAPVPAVAIPPNNTTESEA